MSLTLKSRGVYLIGLLVAALALVAAGCGGDDGGEAPEALPSSSCTAIEYEGDGDPDYIIASDFPLQGSSRTQTEQIVAAIRYELGQRDWKAGDYNIGFQACDDATAQAGKWDSGKCSQNANAYASNDKVIGVIGTLLGVAGGIVIAYNVDVIVPFIERLLGVHFLPREVYFISALPSDPQVGDIVTIGLTSLVLSLLATLYPSWRASRLQPAQVLRHD